MVPRFVYTVFLRLVAPFKWLRLLVRARRELAYAERSGERFELVPARFVGCKKLDTARCVMSNLTFATQGVGRT